MYLHIDNPDLLKDMILYTAEKSGINETIIEKDYYVTLVLKELVKLNSDVVFKGGTSLSKAYKVITRFSEDIDITFENHIGHAKRKKLKYNIMKNVSEYLQLPISNWKEIESDKNYNHYDFEYVSISTSNDYNLRPYIKLETALMSYAFPTEIKEITSVLYDALKKTDRELLVQYELMPFQMKVQSIDRTFIDKIFALCDYYLLKKSSRNSRHLYDIYKLRSNIEVDSDFYRLVKEVRTHRLGMGERIAPSALDKVDIQQIATEIIRSDFYKKDYQQSTMLLINDDIDYETVINHFYKLCQDIFS